MMTSAANAIDEEWVEKKLKGANSSQDSVQSLSLWALNHKTQHEKIVGIWFKVLKTAKLDLRLTLFYLCNEVVQTCKRKHAIVFKDAFKEVLKDAALLVRDNSIRPNIERIFKIWEERHVYNKEFVDELMAILNNTKVKSTMSTRLLAEFKPAEVPRHIKRVAEKEDEVEAKRLQLSEQEWHTVDVESFKQQLKDRHECGQYVDQVNECRVQLESYVTDLQSEIQDRSCLIQLLEQSELFYDAQNSEANIVATAYKNFGSRVNTLHKKLHESRKPPKSSPRNFQSPGTATVKSKVIQKKRQEDPDVTPTEDEFDDDSCEGALVSDGETHFDSYEFSDRQKQSSGRRNSKDDQKTPEFSADLAAGDMLSGSLLPNLLKNSSFLPSLSSHGVITPEVPSAVRGFAPNVVSNSITAVNDEDAGGATPVQDEEPNDEVSLAPMEFLKRVILDSSKASLQQTPVATEFSHPYATHSVEIGTASVPVSSAASWTGYDPAFNQPETHLGDTGVYDSYEESYELIYPSPIANQELSSSAYNAEVGPPYELYPTGFTDRTDASQAYVLDSASTEGYVENYETLVEAYPTPEGAEYQGTYQEQLIQAVVDEGYGDVAEVYPVVPSGDNYQPQAVSGTYYNVLEHVPGAAAPPSVVYRGVQNYAQPPPTFAHPPPSLPPTPSFSHPPPTFTQPTLTFIQPPPVNQPPPPLFAVPQNSSLPPPLPHPFIEPPPHSPYQILSPISAKTSVGLPSPILVSTSLENASSVHLPGSTYRQQSNVKLWNRKPYSQFKNDLVRGPTAVRDSGHFDSLLSPSDLYRLGRNPVKTRRTNLTYLTQTGEDRNGTAGVEEHMTIPSVATDDKPCYPSTGLRSMSLPCDTLSLKSFPGGHDDGLQSASPKSADQSNFFSRSQSTESGSDSLPQASYEDGGNEDGRNAAILETSQVTIECCDTVEKFANTDSKDLGQVKQNSFDNLSPTKATVCNIPTLGVSSSPRALASRNWIPRLSNCRPELSLVPQLTALRFRHDGIQRFPRRPHFVAQRLPFHRNFRDSY